MAPDPGHRLPSDYTGLAARTANADPTPTLESSAAPTGMKPTSGKLRWSLLPFPELREAVEAFEDGARKYSPNNWQLQPDGAATYLDAALRHLVADASGERFDASGCTHIGHAIASLLIRAWFLNHSQTTESTE